MHGQAAANAVVTAIELNDAPPAHSETGRLESYGYEQNGASRVRDSSRLERNLSALEIFRFWLGLNFNSFNITIGVMGPMVYHLTGEQALLTALLAITAGSVPIGIVACLGPQSGLRTMSINRFVIGWIPAMVMALFAVTLLIGYAELDIIASGNMISAVFPGYQLGPVVFVITLSCLAIGIASFGVAALHKCEQWIWLPQLLAVFVLAGAFIPRARSIDTQPSRHGTGTFAEMTGFFNFVFSAVISYTVMAADYWVYYPKGTPQKRLFIGTMGGVWCSSVLLVCGGIALGTATKEIPQWRQAYKKSPGELISTVYNPVGLLGTFCCISLALGNLAAAASGIYSQALAIQSIGGPLARVSRVKWTAISGIIALICAVAGKDSLVELLQNFVAIVGYCVSVWLTISGLEYLMFKKNQYCWEKWNDRSAMPKGYAASLAFVVGLVVSVLSMAETWYVGPIARMGGEDGINVGNFTGPAAAALSYLPSRYVEIRFLVEADNASSNLDRHVDESTPRA